MKVQVLNSFWESLKSLQARERWWHWRRLYYQVKCWLFRPYTTIRPRTLGHRWVDRAALLPHMMFEILTRFYDEEVKGTDRERSYYHENARYITVKGKQKLVIDEIKYLYDWWCVRYMIYYPLLNEQIWQEIDQLDEKYKVSTWQSVTRADGTVVDGLMDYDPQYSDDRAGKRVETLLLRLSAIERALDNALDRRMSRLVAVRQYLWT